MKKAPAVGFAPVAASKWSEGPVVITTIDYDPNGDGTIVIVNVENTGYLPRKVEFTMQIRNQDGFCGETRTNRGSVGGKMREEIVLHFDLPYSDVSLNCWWDMETKIF